MYIEFFGHPYSGKTTLSREFARALRDSGNNVVEPTTSIYNSSTTTQLLKSFQAILTGIHNYNIESIFYDVVVKQGSVSDYLRLYLNGAVVSSVHEKSKKSDYQFVLDQGIAQLAWATFIQSEDEITRNKILQATSRLRSNDVVVLIDVSEKTIKNRYNDDNNRHTRIEDLQFSYNLYRRIMGILKSDEFTAETYSITNDSSLSEAVDQVERVSSSLDID